MFHSLPGSCRSASTRCLHFLPLSDLWWKCILHIHLYTILFYHRLPFESWTACPLQYILYIHERTCHITYHCYAMSSSFFQLLFLFACHTVYGRHPAPVDSLSHYLQGFVHPRWWSLDSWTINSSHARPFLCFRRQLFCWISRMKNWTSLVASVCRDCGVTQINVFGCQCGPYRSGGTWREKLLHLRLSTPFYWILEGETSWTSPRLSIHRRVWIDFTAARHEDRRGECSNSQEPVGNLRIFYLGKCKWGRGW